MSDSWLDFYKKYGKCCACGSKMVSSHHLNNILLNKYAEWDNPAWGNLLASDPDEKYPNKALAIVCDNCLESKKKPIYAVESSGKGISQSLKYHIISGLADADPIIEGD